MLTGLSLVFFDANTLLVLIAKINRHTTKSDNKRMTATNLSAEFNKRYDFVQEA